MENNIEKNGEEILRKEDIIIICPYQKFSKIFNKIDFNVKDLGFIDDKRIILILDKEIK